MPILETENLLTPPHLLAEHSVPENVDPLETFLTWKALSRPYRKKDRSYYTTIAILITLISATAFLMGEKLLIGAILAFAFVVYVLNFVRPEEIEYKLSAQGITVGGHFYHWNELEAFWIGEKEGLKVLFVSTKFRFPKLLMLPLGPASEEEARRLCIRFLPFHEIPPRSLMDKWSEGLQKHFPLENPHS